MDKKDFDEYMQKINSVQTQEEKIEITRSFFERISRELITIDKDKMISFRGVNLVKYGVECGAFESMYNIGLTTIPKLGRSIQCTFTNSLTNDNEELTKKSFEMVRTALQSGDVLTEEGKPKDFELLDSILCQYAFYCIENNKPVDELLKNGINLLQENLPEGMSFRDTTLYKRQLLRGSLNREDFLEVTPKADRKQLERELLSNNSSLLDAKGNPISMKAYDTAFFEYLVLFGHEEDIKIDTLHDITKKIMGNKRGKGYLTDSKAYKEYLLPAMEKSDTYARLMLGGLSYEIALDVLARIYESEGKSKTFTDEEYDIFKSFYMNRTINYEEVDPDFAKEMKKNNPNWNPVREVNGRLVEYLTELSNSKIVSAVEMGTYIIRLQKLFSDANRPKDSKLAEVYDFVKSIDIVSCLEKNLTREKLQSGDKSNIEGADLAIALLFEYDYDKGMSALKKSQFTKYAGQVGMSIEQSKAIGKMVECYVDNENNRIAGYNAEATICEYLRVMAGKEGFNILKEQGVSDLVQLGFVNPQRFDRLLKDFITAYSKNPTRMGVEDARKYIKDFMEKFERKAVLESDEKRFDEFLDALGLITVKDKMQMKEDEIKFIINQAMRKDSVMNQKKDKYMPIVERTIEHLGRLEYQKQTGEDRVAYVYTIRDYIENNDVSGLHSQDRSNTVDSIKVKRRFVEEIFDGDVKAINTLFHENEHMNQAFSGERFAPKSYERYIMLKENVISAVDRSYYDDNYWLFFKEIEAREVAARRSAAFISEIVPLENVTNVADSLLGDVGDVVDFMVQRDKYEKIAQAEKVRYAQGMTKKDSKGKSRNVNELFEETFNRLSYYEKKKFLDKYPGFKLEFNVNTMERRPFEGVMLVVDSTNANLNKDMLKQIAIDNAARGDGISAGPLEVLEKLIKGEGNSNSDLNFMRDVVGSTYPIYMEKTITGIKNSFDIKHRVTADAVKLFDMTRRVKTLVDKNPESKWAEMMKTEGDSGKSIYSMLDDVARTLLLESPSLKSYLINRSNMPVASVAPSGKSSEPLKDAKKPKHKKSLWDRITNSYSILGEIEADKDGRNQVNLLERELTEEKDVEQVEL